MGRGGLCLVYNDRVICGSGLREAFRELGEHIGKLFQETGNGFWLWFLDYWESALGVVDFLAWAWRGDFRNQPVFLHDCC